MISPLAHVDPDAKIGKNVTIHPFAFISKNVEIGDDCIIYPYVSLLTGTRIGDRTKIYNGAIIGAEPQNFRWKGEDSFCYIGSDTIVREHSIINRGLTPESGTRVGSNSFLMAECHIGADAQLADKCVVGNGTQVATRSIVGKCTILSSGVIIHPDSEVGSWVMVKGGCRVSGNVPPYVIVAHNPVTYFGVNATIMRHSKKFSEDMIDDIAKAYRHVYQCNTSVRNALKRIEFEIEASPERDEILNFIKRKELKIVAVPNFSEFVD